MKKLTILFAVVATLGLAGCKKKNDTEAKDQAAKPEEKGEMKKDEMAKPAEGTPPAGAPAGDMPKECADYKAAIDKLASCDKMDKQARDALKQAYDQASASWANIPADQKAAVATACKAGVDSVTASAKATCGW